MPPRKHEYFVPDRKVLEVVLKRLLDRIFSSDAKYRRVRKGDESGWLVESASKVSVEDWLARLQRATRLYEEELRKRDKTNDEDNGAQGRPTSLYESQQQVVRSDSYGARDDVQRKEATYHRHVNGPNGAGVVVTPARSKLLPTRPRDPSRQGITTSQIATGRPDLPRSVSLPQQVYPPRSSSLRRGSEDEDFAANEDRRDRHRDTGAKSADQKDASGTYTLPGPLLRTSTSPLPQRTSSLSQSTRRRTSFGQDSVNEGDSRDQRTRLERHGKPDARRALDGRPIDGPDDDDDDDDTHIGHRGGYGRHGPVSATRRSGRDDDDDDTVGQYTKMGPVSATSTAPLPSMRLEAGQPPNSLTTALRHRGREDDDDDNDGTVGHASIGASSAAATSRGANRPSTMVPMSTRTAYSDASFRRTSVSGVSNRRTSMGATSEKASVLGQPVNRDRHTHQVNTRVESRPATVREDVDSESSYEDYSDEDPSYGKQTENLRHARGKRFLEDTRKRSTRESGRDNIVVARSSSGRERDPRYPNVYKR